MREFVQISFIPLAKPKPIKGFDGKAAQDITHAVNPTLTAQSHTVSLAPFLIRKAWPLSVDSRKAMGPKV